MIKKILEKVGLRKSYFERRVFILALRKIDLDHYNCQRPRLIQYCLEVYGRVDYEQLEKDLQSITPPSVMIKEMHKKGYTHYANFQLMAYKSLVKDELKKLKGK